MKKWKRILEQEFNKNICDIFTCHLLNMLIKKNISLQIKIKIEDGVWENRKGKLGILLAIEPFHFLGDFGWLYLCGETNQNISN